MNEVGDYTGAAGKISDLWRSNGILKIDTQGDKTRCAGISQPELRRHHSSVEDGLVRAVIGRCALVDRLGVGGGRIKTG